jgi:hypothetical protein
MKRLAAVVLMVGALLLGAGGAALAGDPRGGIHVQWER